MKYEAGKIVTGIVSGITEYGAFVKFDEYYSGLIHISEMSDKFVSNINDFVSIGDRVRVLILDIDNETCHLKLSIKNIRYKSNGKFSKNKIIETPHGFSSLAKRLNYWVKDYLKSKKINKFY